MKKRIDSLLLEKNLVESRAKAQALIMAGEVAVDGITIIKSGTLVNEKAEISLAQPPPFVGRGGIKLDYAIDSFGLDVSLKTAADIGASTGGFTDCLLKHGVSRVYAIDVGYGQLDYRLRSDPRVTVMERQNARYPIDLPEKIDMVTIDVSFISVEKIIPSVVKLLKKDGLLVVLIKPQFEARKKEVGKGGVIRESAMHARVLGRFIAWAIKQNLRIKALEASPILGASGNREFFILLKLT